LTSASSCGVCRLRRSNSVRTANAPIAIRLHVLALQGSPDHGKFRLRGFSRHAGAQSSFDHEIVPSAVFQRICGHGAEALGHPQRNVDAGAHETVEAGKRRRGHADDGEDDSVEAQCAADGGAAAGVVLLPEFVPDRGDGLSAGDRSRKFHACYRKEVVRHQGGKANLRRRRGVGGCPQGGQPISREAAEGAALVAQIAVIGVRHAFQRIVGRGVAHVPQCRGVPYW